MLWINANETTVDGARRAPSLHSSRDGAYNPGLSLGVSKGQPVGDDAFMVAPDANHLLSREGYLTALGDPGQTEKSL